MTKAAIINAEAGRNVYIEGRTVTPGLRPEERGKIGATVGVFAFVIDRDADRGKAGRLINGDASAVVETSSGNTHEWLFLSRALSATAAKDHWHGNPQGMRRRRLQRCCHRLLPTARYPKFS